MQIYIVTITDGNIDALERTLQSIDEQSDNHFKNLVISKKKLKNLNKKFKTKKRIFIHKKNSTIYQAMNIGLKKTKNSCVIFLNAGDKFFSASSLKMIFYYLKKSYFKTCLMFISVLENKNTYFIPKKEVFFLRTFLTHSSFIIPKAKKDFGFDIKNKITADGEWMRNNAAKFNVTKIYAPLSIFSLGGISNFPSKKSITMKINRGIAEISKELLKFILLKIVGVNLFYKIIYYYKYNRLDYADIKKFSIKIADDR